MKIINIHRKYFSPERGREQLQKLMTTDRGQFLLHRLDEKLDFISQIYKKQTTNLIQ